jgi:thymidylate synthase ThyX
MKGIGGTEAKIIADSIADGIRLTTLQLKYPRFIHQEFLTHRMFSRNSSSSRAIPVDKMIQQVKTKPAHPIHWGKNKPGMQAETQVDCIFLAQDTWLRAATSAAYSATDLLNQGVHKQVTNRILEPFQFMHTVVTATEWKNFFELRLHPDAQPEIQELAKTMKSAMDHSVPLELKPGQWHLPYISEEELDGLDFLVNLDTLRKASVARCARTSYLNHDNTQPNLEKDLELAYKLLEAGHWSPFEHQATPMTHTKDIWSDVGQTHMDKSGNLWSGNFRGWNQYRHYNETKI